MPLYMIRRNLPGATQDDLDAAGYRAVACAFNYSGLKWVSSYWDRDAEVIHCVYEADSAQQIEDHARRARIPCDEVRLVQAVRPETYAGEPETAERAAT